MNKLYTASVVRERLADALDEAERGHSVIIERRGVRFRLALEQSPFRPRKKKIPARIEVLDDAVAEGVWSWEWKPGSLEFEPRRR